MICITGANGFIGKALTSSLLDAGYKIKTHSKSTPALFNTEHFNFPLSGELDPVFVKDCDTLIHLACSIDKRRSSTLSVDVDTEVKGSANLFEQFIKHNPKGKIIFLSTGGAIYDSTKKTPHKESDPTLPDTSYALTKYLSENILSYLCRKYDYQGVTLRISNPYGELFRERTQGIIGLAISRATTNETLEIFENTATTRDYIHLSDLLSAIFLSIDSNVIKAGNNEVINIGSGNQTSLDELLQLINSISGSRLRYRLTNQEAPPTFNCLSVDKAMLLLNWRPKITLREGLLSMLSNLAQEGRA